MLCRTYLNCDILLCSCFLCIILNSVNGLGTEKKHTDSSITYIVEPHCVEIKDNFTLIQLSITFSTCIYTYMYLKINLNVKKKYMEICQSKDNFHWWYINNAIIKLPIYFTSHMPIAWQIMDIIPEWFLVFQQNRALYKH